MLIAFTLILVNLMVASARASVVIPAEVRSAAPLLLNPLLSNLTNYSFEALAARDNSGVNINQGLSTLLIIPFGDVHCQTVPVSNDSKKPLTYGEGKPRCTRIGSILLSRTLETSEQLDLSSNGADKGVASGCCGKYLKTVGNKDLDDDLCISIQNLHLSQDVLCARLWLNSPDQSQKNHQTAPDDPESGGA